MRILNVKNETKCLEICFLQIIIDFVCSESQPIATNVFVKVADAIKRSNPIVQVVHYRLIVHGTIRRSLQHSFALLFCSSLLQEIGKKEKEKRFSYKKKPHSLIF